MCADRSSSLYTGALTPARAVAAVRRERRAPEAGTSREAPAIGGTAEREETGGEGASWIATGRDASPVGPAELALSSSLMSIASSGGRTTSK